MTAEQQFKVRYYSRYFILALVIAAFLCVSRLFAAQQSTALRASHGGRLMAEPNSADSSSARFRVFSTRHISAAKAIKFLNEIGIGTASKLPSANAILVTAQARQLIKVAAVLKLVDAEEEFAIKIIHPTPTDGNVPSPGILSSDKIAAELGNISIGTFSYPPADGAGSRAIIDVHRDAVVVVAPKSRLKEIISAVEQAGTVQKDESPVTAGKTQAQSDQLFDRLIDSLAEAEEKAADSQKKVLKPDEPVPVAATAQPQPQAEPEKMPQPVQSVVEPPRPPLKISYQPEPITEGNEMLDLDLPEQLEIGDLLRLIGEYLQLDYMYDPAKVKGAVTLKLRGPIKVRDLYPLLESVLKFRDFVMTRKGNLVTIVPVEDVLRIDPVLLDVDKGQVEVGDIIVTRVFKLNYVDTASAENLLAGMKLGVNVTPIAATQTLIVSGYAYRMRRIEELLSMIDKPGKPRQFRFRQLKYTMADALAPKIKTLVEQLGTISITIGKPAAAPPPKPARGRTPPRTRTPAKPAEPTAKPTVYLDADERTNRILMIGLEKELVVVDQLIDSLDVAQQDLRTLRVYDIQHVGAEEVQEKLAELGITGEAPRTATSSRIRRPPTKPGAKPTPSAVSQEGPLEGQPQVVIIEATNSLLVNATAEQHIRIATIISYVDSETLTETIPYKVYSLENQDPVALAEVLNKLIQQTTKDKEGKIERTTKITEDDIVIVPDENTFSIIVYASKKDQKWVANLIKNLDKRRPQVLIDVSLVEITRSEDFEYDLSIIANAKDKLITSNVGVTGTPFSSIATAGQAMLEGGFNLTDSDGKNTKRVQGFYNDDRIQALLTAIDSKGYGRILAKPKILVNDNEEGIIKTTEKVHVGEVSQTWRGEVSPTSTETTVWKPYEAKIELTITPHISEGSLLRLEIAMIREDFVETASGPPDYRTSDIDSIVTVPDGSTIILGGLTKLNQAKAGSKVPLLGDIPLVGALFRSVDNSDTGSKLYIFVKANILRPDETVAGLAQLQEISKTNKAVFERDELKFQSHQVIPGVKTKPMEPEKVLEEGFEESG